MKKIPTLFVRDPHNLARVLPTVAPGCEWVADGEGIATRKFDGTACTFIDGQLHKRREVKEGKAAPEGFVEVGTDNGKRQGWVPVGDGPEDAPYREALSRCEGSHQHGRMTFELVGPKVQGNPEGYEAHTLVSHNVAPLSDVPRTFDGLAEYLAEHNIEGVVWHHTDGRMAKIKGRDFGLDRAKETT